MKKAWDLVPSLKNVKDNNLEPKLYLHGGFRCELKNKHKNKIKEMEANSDLKVITVIEETYLMDGADEVTMVTYIYISDDYDPWIIEDDVVGFYADVVNESWGFEDVGSVGIVEKPETVIKRVY